MIRHKPASPMQRAHLWAALVVAALLAAAPAFLDGYGMYILGLIGVYSTASIGMVILTGHGGLLNLGFSGMLAAGAYVSAHLTNDGVPLPVALLVAVAVGVFAGAIVGVFALWMGDFAVAIVTFGIAVFVTQAVRYLDDFTGGLAGMGVIQVDLTVLHYYIWGTAAVAVAIGVLVLRGWFGRSLRAMRDDPVAATMFGLPVRRTKFLAFVLTTPFVTLAGALYGQTLGYISPEGFGVFLSLAFIMIVILGGVSSLWGAIVGAAIWVLIPEWTSGVTGLYYILFGAVTLAIIRWSPDGVAGIIHRLIDRLVPRAAAAPSPGRPLHAPSNERTP